MGFEGLGVPHERVVPSLAFLKLLARLAAVSGGEHFLNARLNRFVLELERSLIELGLVVRGRLIECLPALDP